MRFAVRLLLIIVVTIPLGSFIGQCSYDSLVSTLYTVVGIVFSVGIGFVSTFDLKDVVNKKFLTEIRLSITKTRNSFISFFALSTIILLVFQYGKDVALPIVEIRGFSIKFDIGIFTVVSLLFSILYFVYNFIDMQKLRDDITDALINEKYIK